MRTLWLAFSLLSLLAFPSCTSELPMRLVESSPEPMYTVAQWEGLDVEGRRSAVMAMSEGTRRSHLDMLHLSWAERAAVIEGKARSTKLCEVFQGHADRYEAASSALTKSRVVAERDAAVAAVLRDVRGSFKTMGVIETLTTTSDGKAVLALSLIHI